MIGCPMLQPNTEQHAQSVIAGIRRDVLFRFVPAGLGCFADLSDYPVDPADYLRSVPQDGDDPDWLRRLVIERVDQRLAAGALRDLA